MATTPKFSAANFFKSNLKLSSIVAPPLPVMLETLCPSDRPLALLPVRLETRFFTLADQEIQKCVFA